MHHGKVLAVTMAYIIYSESAEGNLNPDWRLENPMKIKEDWKEL